MKENYSDMIDMDYPSFRKHPIMDNKERAAQFAPFAALRGYDEVIMETYRETSRKIELDEEFRKRLDEFIGRILSVNMNERPFVNITYFVPDNFKEGGKYVTITGKIKAAHEYDRTLILSDGTVIGLDNVIDISHKE